MDVIQRIRDQFLALYNSMAPSQRATLIAVPLLVVAAFGWLLYQQQDSGLTALSYGKVFTTEELVTAEQAFLQEGLNGFERRGQKLMVPAKDLDRYNAALLKNDAMPSGMGAQLLKQYESLGPFSTEKERQERREAMLLEELERIIEAVPDVEHARVGIATTGRRGWSQRGRTTASVAVRPKGGRELPVRLVRSIQTAVANMVPDLKPADVSVFDVLNGVTHAGLSEHDAFDNQLVQRIDEFQQQYQRKIQQDLSYIPDVGVTVNVDVENLKSSVVRNQVVDPKKFAPVFSQEANVKDTHQSQPARGEAGQAANRPASLAANPGQERSRQFSDATTQAVNGVSFEISEKQLIAAMPKAVQASITVPRDYYRSVAAQRKAAGETEPAKLDVAAIEKEVISAVTASVRTLIPPDSPVNAVIVNSVDVVTKPIPTIAIPWSDRVLDWLRQWGGALLLGLFALYVLRTMSRSVPLPEPLPAATSPELQRMNGQAAEADLEPEREPTRRDMLQTLVKDNPEATAAILSKWLQTAK